MKNNKKRKVKTLNNDAAASSPMLFKVLIFSVPAMLAVWLLLMAVGANIISGMDDPDALASPVAFAVTAAAAFFGGLVSGKLKKSSGLAAGAATGLVLVCIALLLSLTGLCEDFQADMLHRTILLASMMLLSCAGGKAGARKKTVRRSR